MKKLVFSLMLAFAVVGGAVAISTLTSTHAASGCNGSDCQ
jgi:hypothetical protein